MKPRTSRWPEDFHPGAVHIADLGTKLCLTVVSEPFRDESGIDRVWVIAVPVSDRTHLEFNIEDWNMSFWQHRLDVWTRVV